MRKHYVSANAGYHTLEHSDVEDRESVPLIKEKPTSAVWKGAVVALAVGQLVVILLLVQLMTRGGMPSSSGSLPAAPSTINTRQIPFTSLSTPPLDEEASRRAEINAAAVANLGELPLVQMPHKLAVEHVTPRVDQEQRGTCWDFATIGMLEQSYRAQGVANGWIDPDKYVGFSEQAYGVLVLEACRANPTLCLVPGDAIWMNSTEGGEIPLLYYFPELNNSIVPTATCPYIGGGGHDTVCPGLPLALKKNPLKFTIKSMATLYEISSIKNHLRVHKRALGFSTVMTDVSYYYPCTGSYAKRPECKADPCTPCPYDRFPAGSCCIRKVAEPYNLEGEFYTHGKTDFKDGGHAMLLVGYNDNYVTETGAVGGFILKNNWAGGSHSVDYFMQQISRWDESRICPNSINPRNWYDCHSIENCLSPKTQLYADVSYMPLRLKCIHPTLCKVHDHHDYFVKNASYAGDGMVTMCVFEHHADSGKAEVLCLGPYPLDSFAAIFRPVRILPDDPDRCGFYFFPYYLLDTWWATYHDGFATDFETVWDPQSYATNKDKYPDLDYSLVEASTREQNKYVFTGPFPHDMTTNKAVPEGQLPKRPPPPSPERLRAAGTDISDLFSFTSGAHPSTTSAMYRVNRDVARGRESARAPKDHLDLKTNPLGLPPFPL